MSLRDVSNVNFMANMFSGATVFNGNISGWNVCLVPTGYYSNFDYGASNWSAAKPNFGAVCP